MIAGSLLCTRLKADSLIPPVDTGGLVVMTLDGAQIASLGHLGAWPDTMAIDGLTYTRIESTPDSAAARRWMLANHTWDPAAEKWRRHYVAQPFQHLALYLRGLGDDTLAREVLLWQQRAARPQLSRTRKVFSWAMDILAGYGYAPSRAVLILSVSWAAGWAWFSRDGFKWHDGLLVLDMILPASPFGLEDLGTFAGSDLVVASLLIGVSWLVYLTVLPAVTRALSRG